MTPPDVQPVAFRRLGPRIEARFGMNLENHLPEVWAALTQPDRLIEWLAPGAIELRPGGRVSLAFEDSGVVIESVVRALQPQRLLEYSWSGPDEPERLLRWELAPVGSMVALRLTLTAPAEEDMARSAAGWAAHLDMLAAALAGAPIRFPLQVFLAARSAYRDQLAAMEKV